MTVDIEQIKKKIIYRSNYRGTKEMDKLLGAFTSKYLDQLKDEDLNQLIKFDPIMICSNPDKTVIRGEKFMICAGLLAEYYQKIGGKVEFYGKPHSEIYEFTYLKIKNKTSQILVIGDSLENDIKGANLQNLDSLLITNGIHREVNNDNGVDKEKLNDLIRKKKISPNYFMKDLIF